MNNNRLRYFISRSLSLILAFMLAFSGAAVTLTANSPAVQAEAAAAKISKKKKTIYVGKSFTLKIKNSKKNYKWASSNNAVAMILTGAGNTAQIGGIKPGKAVITATYGKKVFKCKVTVKAAPEDIDKDGKTGDGKDTGGDGKSGDGKDTGDDGKSGDEKDSGNDKKTDTGEDTGKSGDSKSETVNVHTLEEELASDTYGLLYERKVTDYSPRTNYTVETEEDLQKAMIDAMQTGTHGIIINYKLGNYSYWNDKYLKFMNSSELNNAINVFYPENDGNGVMAIYPVYKQSWNAIIYYKYRFEDYVDDEAKKILKMAHEIAEDAVKAHPGDEKAILKYANDRICDLTVYSNPIPTDKDDPARDATGVFLNNNAVCEGYTAALSMVLTILGFENHAIKNKKDNHVWNRVKVDGTWYNIDATWNDQKDSKGNYYDEWFMLTDSELAKKNGNDDGHAFTQLKYVE